jgi:hypothetical protein
LSVSAAQIRFNITGDITGPVGHFERSAILLEQNDGWSVQRSRYLSLESVAPLSDNTFVSLPILAA